MEITGDYTKAWLLLREDHGADRATVILQHDEIDELWQVYRRVGRVSAAAAQANTGARSEFEVAVAVPQKATADSDGALCVFFPTHDRVPCALAMHATLETTDDRNRLLNHKSNQEVLKELAAHVAAVAEEQATPADPRRALELLAGVEHADPERQLSVSRCPGGSIAARGACFPASTASRGPPPAFARPRTACGLMW